MVRTKNENRAESRRSREAAQSRRQPAESRRMSERRRPAESRQLSERRRPAESRQLSERRQPAESRQAYRRRQPAESRRVSGRVQPEEYRQPSGADPAPHSAMNLRMVGFMVAGIVVMTALLIFYIKLHADVTSSSREIADLEEQLSEMKSENDAAYNEINDRISLEEVRDKAINELGMKYADKDQVVIYSGTEEDSVHQVSEVGGK